MARIARGEQHVLSPCSCWSAGTACIRRWAWRGIPRRLRPAGIAVTKGVQPGLNVPAAVTKVTADLQRWRPLPPVSPLVEGRLRNAKELPQLSECHQALLDDIAFVIGSLGHHVVSPLGLLGPPQPKSSMEICPLGGGFCPLSASLLYLPLVQRDGGATLPRKPPPPAELTSHLEAIGKALDAIGSDQDDPRNQRALSTAVDAALQTAVRLAKEKRSSSWSSPGEATFTEIIAGNVRRLRLEAGWTQQQIADAMAVIGFGWGRETSVEVERTGRKMQLEEVVGIAALFGVPVLDILLPDDDTALDLPRTNIDRAQLCEMILGRGGEMGEGGPDWIAAVSVLGAGRAVERPAVDLWQTRGKS